MKVLLIAQVGLLRLARDRTNVFFVLLAPFLLILVLGQLFGGQDGLRLGVVAAQGQLADRLVTALGSGTRVTVTRAADEAALRTAVERGEVHAGLVLPASYDASLAAGRTAAVRYLIRRTDLRSHDVGTWVRSVVRQESARVLGVSPTATVTVSTAGRAVFPEGLSAFAISAPPLLLLFTFLTSLTAALGLVETRALGVSRRVHASPTRVGTVIAGEALGRVAIALAQGALIMAGSALLFGVDWGDPFGAVATLLAFSLVGAGAAMLLGASFKTPGPPISLAMILGLGLSALGGGTVPLESFDPTLRTIAHLTPHAWGYDAFAQLVRHDAGFVDVLPQLGVLTGLALVLFALGTWRLRRALT
ncbi:ABC transporter permease [Nonomuraea dietziae]|uniref:ABC-2 type transport system permease protein n=1 Tax=Nonomuraea dietziae TaxID=65515 RepID=A0A7W5VCT7_9ACTN|nr:ABC transporter permease [Nonomuraea dietziae]MBB3731255.1 ABC-2 type transport system permease protein [Nonomuraea dietziae]